MSVRTKLITALISMAFLPLLLSGFIIYSHSKDSLFTAIENQLKETASVQTARVAGVVERYLDIMKMLANRPTLKTNLALYNSTSDVNSLKYIDKAIGQIIETIPIFHEISILNTDRKVVSSSNSSTVGMVFKETDVLPERYDNCSYVDVFKGQDNIPDIRLTCHLKLNNKIVGFVTAIAHGGFINEVTADYSNLGKTGETVVAKKDENGNALFIVPLRFDTDAAFKRKVLKEATNVLITQALQKKNNLFREFKDYHGVPVYGVTGYLEKTGWGIVVKMYKSEMMEPLVQLKNILIYSYIFIMGILIIAAMYISRYITAPLTKLKDMAVQVSKGDFSQKITTTLKDEPKDEICVLVLMFNMMIEKLADRDIELSKHRQSLEVLVDQRTGQLRAVNELLESVIAIRKASEEQYRALVENSADIISRIDKDNRYIYINPAVSLYMNLKPEDFIGKTNSQAGVHAYNTVFWEETIQQIFATRRQQEIEIEMEEHGVRLYFSCQLIPEFDDIGAVKTVVSVLRDITKRVELEHQLMERNEQLEDIVKRRTAKLLEYNENLMEEVRQRKDIEAQLVREKHLSDTIVDTMPGIFCLLDSTGMLLLWNKNMETITGYSYDHIKGKTIFDFIEGGQKNAAKYKDSNVFINIKGNYEKNLYSKSGQQIPFYFVGSIIVLDNVSYLTLIGIDITKVDPFVKTTF